MLDPYNVLGVPRDAGMDEIKKAYRKLSRTYHPDANIDNPNKAQAEEKFKQIQEAYNQILKEKERGASSYSSDSRDTAGSYGPWDGIRVAPPIMRRRIWSFGRRPTISTTACIRRL